jgi:hypothetical protein
MKVFITVLKESDNRRGKINFFAIALALSFHYQAETFHYLDESFHCENDYSRYLHDNAVITQNLFEAPIWLSMESQCNSDGHDRRVFLFCVEVFLAVSWRIIEPMEDWLIYHRRQIIQFMAPSGPTLSEPAEFLCGEIKYRTK